MQDSYTSNYLKIYFWKFISIITGFFSLLIVLPHLSNNIELFGIYSFCISLTIYLTYSDFGFLGAGQKYAAEAYASGERNKEIKILGFTIAILLLAIFPFSSLMIFSFYKPSIFLSDLSFRGFEVAGSLFLILGLLFPLQIFLQRLAQSILIIRVKDYISLRVDVIANMVKILSVFYFFNNNNYMIVEYFLFATSITILSYVFILHKIKLIENYDFVLLLKSIRLGKTEYKLTKKLAFSSFALTLGWLIYYELDLIIIGKIFGVREVAIYAIGFTFLNFLRSLWNSVFSPFAQRFNHFIAEKSYNKIKQLINNLIDFTLPLCVIVTFVLILLSNKIVIYWVGTEYEESILIMQILILGTFFTFINLPAGHYFSALTKYKYLNILALMFPTVFLIGMYLLYSEFQLTAIAISKSFTNFIAFLISIIGIYKTLNVYKIFSKWLIPSFILILIFYFGFDILIDVLFVKDFKSSYLLIKLILFASLISLISYFLMLLLFKKNRIQVISFLKKSVKYFSCD